MGHPPFIKDFGHIIESISKIAAPDALTTELIEQLLRQFTAFHAYSAFRFDAAGPMKISCGKKRTTEKIDLNTLKLRDTILQAVEKHEYVLIPRISWHSDAEQIRSAIIVPIMFANSCNGVIYLANRIEHEHYTISDIDYLIMISLHIGAIVSKFTPPD
jgi:GAF domain-containing protein